MRHILAGALKQTYSKFINVSLAAIIGLSGLVAATPLLFGRAALAAATPTIVNSLNTNGWAAQDGNPTYVDGPTDADGNGSLKLTTDSQSKQDYFHAASTSLSDVSGLGYKLYDTAGVPASYQLQVLGVHRTDSTSTFTSLVWEPAYNGQTNGPNGAFVSENNLENGIWWSSHPIAGDPLGNNGFVSLSAIQAANPDATVVAYGVNVGSGTPNATSYVDDVSFGSTVTNFEMAPSAANGDFAICTKAAGCGYDGIDVGFSLSDFTAISSISVTLSKNGQDLATNTAKQDMLDYYNNGVGKVLSTPFVISAGTFDPSSDAYWSYGAHSWAAYEQPDTATVTVTGTDSGGATQTISTTNTNLTQGLASFASFFPGTLTVGCNSGDYADISAAVAATQAGDTIYVCADQTVTSAINVNQKLNIIGIDNATINTSGSDYALKINPAAAGSTLSNLSFNKTDTVSDDAMVYVGASNVTISGNKFIGLFNIGDGETIRGLVIAGGLSGLSIDSNTFSHLRQPAYINGSAGIITNNYTEVTKGWVVVSESNMSFSQNTWGAGSSANLEDIAIIPDVPVGADNYTDILGISQANKGAIIENQVSGSKILVSGSLGTPTVNGSSASLTLPAANDIVAATATTSGNIQVTIPAGTTVTADNSSWNGTITPPTVMSNSSVSIPTPSGTTATVAQVIEVGAGNINLTFDKAAQLILPGQTNKLVGFERNGTFTQITDACSANSQTAGDNLPAGGDCYISVGGDMVIWTKHFTTFVAYTQSANPSSGSSGSSTNSPSSGSSSTDRAATTAASTTASNNGSSSDNSEVLGANSSGTPQILSNKTNKPSHQIPLAVATSRAKIFGLVWYWWIPIIIALVIVLGIIRSSFVTTSGGKS